MASHENRVSKLEQAQYPVADLTPKLVITCVCPQRGITGARWLDGSTLDRAEGETEAAFRERVTARSAMVFADAKYGGPTIKLLSDDLRL
jgi:hypothetical protein